MRRIGDNAFFREFDRMLGPSLRDTAANAWTIQGVRWCRRRHSFACPAYSSVTEVITGESLSSSAWSVLVVREHWWKGGGREVLRSNQWASLLSGRREQLLDWLETAAGA